MEATVQKVYKGRFMEKLLISLWFKNPFKLLYPTAHLDFHQLLLIFKMRTGIEEEASF